MTNGDLHECLMIGVALFFLGCAGCDRLPWEGASAEGESCTRTADCESGLKCVALVCLSESNAMLSEDLEAATPSDCEGAANSIFSLKAREIGSERGISPELLENAKYLGEAGLPGVAGEYASAKAEFMRYCIANYKRAHIKCHMRLRSSKDIRRCEGSVDDALKY